MSNQPKGADTPDLREILARLVYVIDAAGLVNLSNGVQLGQTSWYVKASDAMEAARRALAAPEGAGTSAVVGAPSLGDEAEPSVPSGQTSAGAVRRPVGGDRDIFRALRELADAADEVGVRHFDTDTLSPEVERMREATAAARAAISRKLIFPCGE